MKYEDFNTGKKHKIIGFNQLVSIYVPVQTKLIMNKPLVSTAIIPLKKKMVILEEIYTMHHKIA